MILTEAEARTKWCPFVRPIMLDNGRIYTPYGREVKKDEYGVPVKILDQCIASACMAWQQETKFELGRGWCGLAGSPR